MLSDLSQIDSTLARGQCGWGRNRDDRHFRTRITFGLAEEASSAGHTDGQEEHPHLHCRNSNQTRPEVRWRHMP
jgi:hypothetical protein